MPHPKKERESEKEIKRGGGDPIFPITAAAFPCCTATNKRCCRLENDLASPMTHLRQQSSSLKNEKVSGSKGPSVSMATSVKLWHWLRAVYISSTPASLVALGR